MWGPIRMGPRGPVRRPPMDGEWGGVRASRKKGHLQLTRSIDEGRVGVAVEGE